MEEPPIEIPVGTKPRWTFELFQDGNGNWFASVKRRLVTATSCQHTESYTSIWKALSEAESLVRELGP